jgi:hypothetical protein
VRRSIIITAGVLAAAIVGSVATIAVRGGSSAPAAPKPPPVTTATVVRTTLADSVLMAGTLGYAPTDPVVNRLTGTYTQLPSVGTLVSAGQVLYRVDNLPVVLMTGGTPAWRPFAAGMTDGPDVAELQSTLIGFGDAAGLFSTASGDFDSLTVDAIERWQRAEGQPATGQIPLGQVVFLPSAVLVGAESVAIGHAAAPGDLPYQVTTTARTVTVPLDPTNAPTVSVGEPVTITLPSNSTTPGTITAIGPVPPSPSSSSSSSQGSSSSAATPSEQLTVTPSDPSATGTATGVAVQVSLTTEEAANVLAAPISALLALSGGGYGVEIVEPSGTHRLVGVTTGLYSNTLVEVRGSGIVAGTKVVVSQ